MDHENDKAMLAAIQAGFKYKKNVLKGGPVFQTGFQTICGSMLCLEQLKSKEAWIAFTESGFLVMWDFLKLEPIDLEVITSEKCRVACLCGFDKDHASRLSVFVITHGGRANLFVIDVKSSHREGIDDRLLSKAKLDKSYPLLGYDVAPSSCHYNAQSQLIFTIAQASIMVSNLKLETVFKVNVGLQLRQNFTLQGGNSSSLSISPSSSASAAASNVDGTHDITAISVTPTGYLLFLGTRSGILLRLDLAVARTGGSSLVGAVNLVRRMTFVVIKNKQVADMNRTNSLLSPDGAQRPGRGGGGGGRGRNEVDVDGGVSGDDSEGADGATTGGGGGGNTKGVESSLDLTSGELPMMGGQPAWASTQLPCPITCLYSTEASNGADVQVIVGTADGVARVLQVPWSAQALLPPEGGPSEIMLLDVVEKGLQYCTVALRACCSTRDGTFICTLDADGTLRNWYVGGRNLTDMRYIACGNTREGDRGKSLLHALREGGIDAEDDGGEPDSDPLTMFRLSVKAGNRPSSVDNLGTEGARLIGPNSYTNATGAGGEGGGGGGIVSDGFRQLFPSFLWEQDQPLLTGLTAAADTNGLCLSIQEDNDPEFSPYITVGVRGSERYSVWKLSSHLDTLLRLNAAAEYATSVTTSPPNSASTSGRRSNNNNDSYSSQAASDGM